MENTQNKLNLIFGDVGLGVHGPDHEYLFSYDKKGLESIRIDGREWLLEPVKPIFWRATTDNDRGAGFPQKVASWLGADLFQTGSVKTIWVDQQILELPLPPVNNKYNGDESAQEVAILYEYQLPVQPQTKVEILYQVNAIGQLKVKAHYFGQKGLPELPVFGVRFMIPTLTNRFIYTGLSGETYPDRKQGGQFGTYHVQGIPVTPYLIPQDNGVHMETQTVTLERTSTKNNVEPVVHPFELTVRKTKQPFAFSCLPYTAAELENATHQEELPLPRKTVLSILGSVRGVGGIDSWGAEVLPDYRISGEIDHEFEFMLE
ncbi:beta-galactosidase small subunit [Weissella koreensis]|uniref:beta-galactosidase n=1 Tax=Weissella koreensis TaxID=165096 RepID=A0A7H1ML36_9LACO|nr:beta-galactosidase small subunit [Weissella koreensis]AVH74968.1 beta-galactosidase small subunit [Weissella koreensis]QNT64172.1 beta-galactosidase small subunit [Weissella koreensis]